MSSGPLSTPPRAGWSYIVRIHEHVNDKYANVTLKCVGYATEGVKPVEWEFVLSVPRDDLAKWPLGAKRPAGACVTTFGHISTPGLPHG